MQVNRQIKGNRALDDVDHALGRPYRVRDTYRNHYATRCPNQKAAMRASEWWNEGITRDGMTFFHVTLAGREALARELSDADTYGRLYAISRCCVNGEALVMAKSRSAAKYAAFVESDLDWSFMEFCEGLRVRLAA